MDFASVINGINQATQTVGAINGAMNVLVPTVQSVEYGLNSVANVFVPNRGDYYMPPQQGYYPPPNYGAAPPPNGISFAAPDESPIMGTVGNAISGAAIGGWLGPKMLTPPSALAPQVGEVSAAVEGNLAAKIPPNVKSFAMQGLKAGGIGAAVGGVFSAFDNISKLSKNYITTGEAVGNITADTAVGFFTGTGALAAGSLGAKMAGALFKGSGVAGIIGGAVLGTVGAVGVDMLMRGTGIRQAISDGVRQLVD